MKLILVGAHGTGKTTLANLLSERLGWPVIESASRDIRSLMDSGKINIGEKDYHELITAINVKLWKDTDRASDNTNFIYARTIIDNIAYSDEYVGLNDLHKSDLYNQLKLVNGLNAFRNSLIIRVPIEFSLEDDGVRYTDPDYQKKISERQQCVLSALCYDEFINRDDILVVHGSPEERLNQVLDVIASRNLLKL
jgi:predicted ATPase